MPTPQFSLPGGNDPAAMRDYIIKLQRDLQYLLTNLDDLNVSRLNARVIVSESITTDKLAADSITTDKLDANAVTADKIDAGAVTTDKLDAEAVTADKIEAGAVKASKIDVDELSAISADLGHITAGLIEAIQIFGSYIATAQGTYPRIELSSVDNLLKALANASQYVDITPINSNSVPGIGMVDVSAGRGINFYVLSGNWYLIGIGSTDININASGNGDINFNVQAGVVSFNSWEKLFNRNTSRTLQQDLDAKQNTIVGASGTFQSADAKTVTVTNGIVTGIV